jgi:hypothetical protein
MDDVSQGYQGNGHVGTYYTPAQYCEMEHQDLEEMEQIVMGMQDRTEDKEDEIKGLGHGTQVTFRSNNEEPGSDKPPQTPAADRLHKDLSGLTHQGSLPQSLFMVVWVD